MRMGMPMLRGRTLRNQRAVTVFGLAAVVALCWVYLLTGAGTMQDMGGMAMPMSVWPWTAMHAAQMFVMWLVMMAAMMLPSVLPVILLYGMVSRRSAGALATSGAFALGYVATWGGFSVAAVVAQFLLEWAEFLSPMMEATSTRLSGILLIAAGTYQFTPAKRSCLRLCRSPLEFLVSHWRAGYPGAFGMGMRHGAYCVACCWGIMLLLFVGGVMNLLWIIGLTMYVLVEKLASVGPWFGHAAGVALLIVGTILLVAGPA